MCYLAMLVRYCEISETTGKDKNAEHLSVKSCGLCGGGNS